MVALRPRLAGLILGGVMFVGVLGSGVLGSAATTAPTQATSAHALVWPGAGRMLSDPLVVGGSVLGAGSLEMVGDRITTTHADFDQAPPELSLRLFTMVPTSDGGFSAILRFRVPIVVLHSWRGHAVRQAMTVVLTPPSGAARAVQLQPDGSAAVGTWTSGHFSATGSGQAVISGDVAVFGIPASFATSPAWTVQAIVTVQADVPLHPIRAATGYAAGTSIVPVGLLTGAAGASAGLGVADATTALTSAPAGSPGTPGLRPTAVRIEGRGRAEVAVVTLDGSPLQVPGAQYPHLNLDIAAPGFATLEHPSRVTWLPNGSQPAASAVVSVDTIAIGDVPVSVSANEVRFALGAFRQRSSVAAPPTPFLNTIRYRVTVPIGRDETVSSTTGVTGPATTNESVDLAIDGPRVTVTPASPGLAAHGLIDVAGHFTAISATDSYTGSVDAQGNVVMYQTTTAVTTTRSIRTVAQTDSTALTENGDITIRDPGPLFPEMREKTSLKNDNSGDVHFQTPSSSPDPTPDPDSPDQIEDYRNRHPQPVDNEDAAFSNPAGPSQPGGAQGGNPDWPNTPTVAASATGGAAAGSVVRVTAGTLSAGRPIDVTTPWMLPSMVAGSPATAGSASGGGGGGSGSSSAPVAIIAALVVVVIGGGVLVVRRTRS